MVLSCRSRLSQLNGHRRTLISSVFTVAFTYSGPIQAATPIADPVRAKDLTVILPAGGSQRVAVEDAIFPAAWWEQIHSAFAKTSVGDAVERESPLANWRLVAMRLAPCQPLLPYLSERNDVLCQPELRLVWQPIEQRYRKDRWVAYADDRAVHVLYRFNGERELGVERAKIWQDLLHRGESLSVTEIETYKKLTRTLVKYITAELQDLRNVSLADEYDGVGERPEFENPSSATRFVASLHSFIAKHARPELLTQLTTFSLPEGREPEMIDEWVFVAFEPTHSGQDIQPQSLTVRSRRDGRILVDYGVKARASVRRDDEVLQALIENVTGENKSELDEAVIWTFGDRKSKGARISDPKQTHVAHTSCVSCHKLGKLSFDLHNLSYFEDRGVSISPRVEMDVKRELAWIAGE